MGFTLIPPIIVKKNIAVSIIQVGDMEFAESLIITMASYSSQDLVRHWYSEINECLSGRRSQCCIISGLTVHDGTVIPTEWWSLYFIEKQVKFHYQVFLSQDSITWKTPNKWWENIPPYDSSASEWVTTPKELEDWCNQCAVLLSAIEVSQEE